MHSSLTCLVLALCITSFVSADFPLVGVVLLQSAPQYDAFGSVTLTQQNEGAPVIIEGVIFNLKPNSRFGLHVHEQGDLTNACLSAGAHFNPYIQRVSKLCCYDSICFLFEKLLAWQRTKH